MMRILVPFVIVTGLFLASCGGSTPAPSPAPPPAPKPSPPATTSPTPTAVNAVELYKGNCAVCHGQNRQGVPNVGPALTPESLSKLSDDKIREIITEGKSNTAMTGFKGRLSPGEINTLIQFIKAKGS